MITRKRSDLGRLIKEKTGCNNVYFQPPSNTLMRYPCIIYKLKSGDTSFADDRPYFIKKQYEMTVVDANPDSEIPDILLQFESCVLSSVFVSDNLNHWNFSLYF